MNRSDLRTIIREEVEKYLLSEERQEDQAILSWDTSKIFDWQVNFILENPEDFYHIWAGDEDMMEIVDEKDFNNFVQNLKDAGLYEKAEDYVREEVNQDEDLYSEAYNELLSDLTELIEDRNPSGIWIAEGRNLGWRNQSGKSSFKAITGQEFLNNLLPDTDCTFYIYDLAGSKGFHIVNYHHDSPTGEYYDVYPKNEVLRENISKLTTSNFNEYGELEVGEDIIQFYVGYDRLSLEDIEEIGTERVLEGVKKSISEDDSGGEGDIEFEDRETISWVLV